MSVLYLAEPLFTTIQGEGFDAGSVVTFLRLAGCNMTPNCSWCDTKYSWNGSCGTEWAEVGGYKFRFHNKIETEVLAKQLTGSRYRNLVITGGEPMIQQDGILDLLDCLDSLESEKPFEDLHRWKIRIETNGMIAPRPLIEDGRWECHDDFGFTISPKIKFDVKGRALDNLLYVCWSDLSYTVKFVMEDPIVDSGPAILDFIKRSRVSDSRVCVMPCSTDRHPSAQKRFEKEVVVWCIDHNLHFSPRLHVIYGVQ